MFFADLMSLEAPRRSSEGYLGVHAKSARSGVYQYLGREVDPEGASFQADQVVNVYRAPEEVFNARALGSFVAKPITDDHPSEAVTAANWRDLARGTIMGAVQEGQYVGFDLAFLDGDVIESIDSGKRELSCGYSSEIVIGDGVAPDGTAYQARQVNIRGNHCALVAKGRAGTTCRVGDAATCEPMPSEEVRKLLADGRTYNDGSGPNKNDAARRETSNSGGSQVATKTITFDGLPLEVTDAAEAAITKLQSQIKTLVDEKSAADTKVAALTTDKSTLEAKVTTLEQQVKDAKLTPAQLRDAAKAFAATLDTAKKLASAATINDTMDEAAIKRAVVSAKLGDAAKDWTDEQIAVSFDTLAAQTKDGQADPVRNALAGGVKTVGDAKAEYEAARTKYRSNLSDAWKGAPANAA